MRFENKLWNRTGDKFFNRDNSFDLSEIKCVHSGVDTLKQLFGCLIRQDVLLQIVEKYDSGFENIFNIGGTDFLLSKSGKTSGYQWNLRNSDLGFVVLLKSFYSEEDLNASHLKIEVSPLTIFENTPRQLTAKLLRLARLFGTQIKEVGVAAHIAVDLKGFEVPSDFEYKLVTKAKRQIRHLGISDLTLGIQETNVVHGDRQTFTFGSASGLQFQLYDKVTEAVKRDKIGYWEDIWKKVPSDKDCFKSEYQEGDSVRRLEMRFHHSIIREFCNGTKDKNGNFIQINNFIQLSEHLTALWQYALNNFRLQHSSSYIHPVWQKLLEDVMIYNASPDLMYIRKLKPASAATRRNTAFWLAHVLKLQCRKGKSVEFSVRHITSAGLESELMDYFGINGFKNCEFLPHLLHEFVQLKFQKLRLNGVLA